MLFRNEPRGAGERERFWASLIAAQRGRGVLWLPVAMALGAGFYLSASQEPPLWLAPSIGAAFALCALILRRWGGIAGALALLCALAAAANFGAAAGGLRTSLLERPRLAAAFGPGEVIGVVERIDAGARSPRLLLRLESLAGQSVPPIRVRITVPEPLSPGRRVRCWARLSPPEPPMLPGGYDPQRRAYFDRLSATGFALGRCRPLVAERRLTVGEWIAAWRRDLTETIAAAAPGRGGALAAALVTGDRSLVPAEVNASFQASGLAHLLSVSGLHMAIVAGLVYGALHLGLALAPGRALAWPIRKIAAGAAILAVGAYLIVSGNSVPAQRAFVMTSVALGAVLIDRPAISMRGLAVAAALILALQPEAAIDPGFQMSFAATGALIALYEGWVRRAEALPSPGPIVAGLRWLQTAIWASALTSVAAGLATDPIALHHFQRFAIYGLPANMATAPVTTLIIAPAAMVAALLAPFGAAEPALGVMAFGLEQIAAVADVFAARPEAVAAAPAMGEAAFLSAMLALWIGCLMVGRARWLALAPAAAAVLLALNAPKPVVLATAKFDHVLVQTTEPGMGGWRWVAQSRGGRVMAERLGVRAGLSTSQLKALPPLEGCVSGAVCQWRAPNGAQVTFIPNKATVTSCPTNTWVLATGAAATPCDGQTVIRPDSTAGGLLMIADQQSLRPARGRPPGYLRPWSGGGSDPVRDQ